ncbi:protoglobin domain-containing protein [Myxococcus sp. RHSTA-1-4]|uniref:protoglobin domain-containing protein n=1 Tax=Myxococcus sp. RHSTA-1-4 TaxID=2874601 RepID=UPI001CBD1FBA|nr:protoglobin domain-containing protein [Myxococcus sp. RHSTA-1-4]MBZ4420213.1 STAS domain-containing protein [Myxococcus sp. RHSTA-1-4]
MPNSRDYMARLGFDAQELSSRRHFFQLTDEDLARLAALRPFAERHNDAIIDAFYNELLLQHPESRLFFTDQAVFRRAVTAQKRYFLQLFSGVCDLDYMEDRLRVGTTHQRIGVAPKWYLGAYAHYLRLISSHLFREQGSSPDSELSNRSIQKIVFFDMSIAIETYIAAGVEAIQRHQSAIRELSTPVIQISERVLLLPLIGTIDTVRAQQVMEKMLARVVEAQARVIILDIAGVPVVDTRVANHLLQTTEAVRLLGATTILTGIRAQVAQTLVQLGVDLSTMHTCSSLQEGLEMALSMTGRAITTRGA